MKCQHKILVGIISLVFCSLFGLLSPVFSGDTYAASWSHDFYSDASSDSGYLRPLNYDWDNSFVVKRVLIDVQTTSFTQSGSSLPSIRFDDYTSYNIQRIGVIFPYVDSTLYSNGFSIDTCFSYNTSSIRFIWYENFNYFKNNLTKLNITFYDECSSGSTPSGSLEITENGTYDVTNYAQAVVDIPETSGGGEGGDYSDELHQIIVAIYTCGAVVLVIYFFYCIYRMIIKSTGGR